MTKHRTRIQRVRYIKIDLGIVVPRTVVINNGFQRIESNRQGNTVTRGSGSDQTQEGYVNGRGLKVIGKEKIRRSSKGDYDSIIVRQN
jgi:hypothetical protein